MSGVRRILSDCVPLLPKLWTSTGWGRGLGETGWATVPSWEIYYKSANTFGAGIKYYCDRMVWGDQDAESLPARPARGLSSSGAPARRTLRGRSSTKCYR